MLRFVLQQAQRDFDAHLSRLQRYIGQPSVSAKNGGIDEIAQLLGYITEEFAAREYGYGKSRR